MFISIPYPGFGSNLAWQVGRGNDILIRVDPIVGSHTVFYLPDELRSYLQDLDICTLAQAQNTQQDAQSYCYSAEELNLGGTFLDLWTDYVAGLSGAGIRITGFDDELVWDYSKKTDSLFARDTYNCIVSSSSGPATSPVDAYIWNKSLPNKISCFIWLAVRYRILTWENLQKKGKQGPGICVLCNANGETVEHLFTKCAVWKMVAEQVCDHLNLHAFLSHVPLVDMLLD